MRAKGSFSPIFFFFFFLVSLSGGVQIGVLSKERGREEKKGGKERRRHGTNVGVNEGGRARERGESPRVALIRGPLHPPAYPSRREAIIFSAPKARYVSMRIRLYRSNANSDSTGSDLLPVPNRRLRPPPGLSTHLLLAPPIKTLCRGISYRVADKPSTKYLFADIRDEFPFFLLSLASFPLPSRM